MHLWIILFAALLLPKENRNAGALAILIATAAWMLVVLAVAQSNNLYPIAEYLKLLVIPFTILWLLSGRIAGVENKFARFIVSALLVIILAALGMIFLARDWSSIGYLISALITWAALLISFCLAAFLCRKRFTPVIFMLWLLVAIPASLFAVCAPFMLFSMISAFSGGFLGIFEMILIIVIYPMVCGVLLYVFILPFMLIVLNNNIYRKRFGDLIGTRAVKVYYEKGCQSTEPLQSASDPQITSLD